MVGFPIGAVDKPAANVAPTGRFAQHFRALRFGEKTALLPHCLARGNSVLACGTQPAQFSSEGFGVCEGLVGQHFIR
jgi:hypothetical protein